MESISFTVNGQLRTINSPPDRLLLEVLREELGLTGTKYGCGEGQCGACTVLVDGQPVHACKTPVGNMAGRPIQTIEGLATDDDLHPVQEAFLAENAFQCGYCTPGMIMGTVALLQRRPRPTDEEISAAMRGHICRCGGYPRILKAIHRAAQQGAHSMNHEKTTASDSSTPRRPVACATRRGGNEINRRDLVKLLGAGLLFSIHSGPVSAQRTSRSARNRREAIAARIHLDREGHITVLSGKIEMGQGARAELAQAAAEELRCPLHNIRVILGDTSLVPDDGITAGSRTTPNTVPAVRRCAAAARQALAALACAHWGIDELQVEVREGLVKRKGTQETLSFAELAATEDLRDAFAQLVSPDVVLTAVEAWQVLGSDVARPNARDLVTGKHAYPSDMAPAGVMYGKVLRPPSYGATLLSVDTSVAEAMAGVVVVREQDFIGVAAPTTYTARQAIEAISQSATWSSVDQPTDHSVFEYLRASVENPLPDNPFAEEIRNAETTIRATYRTAYVQHVPMETRTALAYWQDGSLTVWTGTQNPFGYRRELATWFQLPQEKVRVVVPDFGCGFGGKHTAEAAVESARLARSVGRPVSLTWTRQEEFTWAYFRPAAIVDVEASVDATNTITSWHFVNINSGAAAIDTPYRIGKARSHYVRSNSPFRQGSYRVLAATANTFARECFMDEIASQRGLDPLQFRLAHLTDPRLRAVLVAAATRFDWDSKRRATGGDTGFGLACGTEKGSYVAACVEVNVDRASRKIKVCRVCEVFECGAVINPNNLLAQVQGCVIMGLGPALTEAMHFENGQVRNDRLSRYRVPRFDDVPELDIQLLNRPDLPSAGGGETPIIAIAPAIANAVFHVTATRVRQMPIRLP